MGKAWKNFLVTGSLFIFAFVSLLGMTKPASAVDLVNPICFTTNASGDRVALPADKQPQVCKEATSTADPLLGPNGVLTKVVHIISLIVGISAVIVIIIAGLRFMISNGDPAKIASARTTIIFAAVGVAVAAVAQLVVAFVLSRVG